MSDDDGKVSVELLNVERETCDRIRSDNDRLRALNADLLEALRHALVVLDYVEGGLTAAIEVRAAIAKADGRS